jgi:hypothetical protein
MQPFETYGQPAPLGANVTPAGVNFSLFSRTASGVGVDVGSKRITMVCLALE